MVSKFHCFAVLTFLFVSTSSTFAISAPTVVEKETARRLMDEGRLHTKNHEFPEAVESFRQAHEIMHVPTTGLALAKAHLDLGQLVEARDVALQTSRIPIGTSDPAVFEEARAKASELETKLKPRIPRLRIRVNAHAKVVVDDKELAGSLVGTPVAMNPGRHVVHASLGDDSKSVETELAESEEKDIEIVLKEPAARAPRPADPLAPSRKGGIPVLTVAGIVIGGAGLAVGSVFGIMTLSTASTVEKSCTNGKCDPSAKSDLDKSNTLALVSTVGFGVAIVGGALAVVGILGKGKASVESKPLARVEPWIGATSLGVQGQFQ